MLVIGDYATCLAFSLAGIATRTAKGREASLEALNFALHNHEIGLVLITEKLAAAIGTEIDEVVYTQHQTLVVKIPDTTGPLPGRTSAGERIVTLIGH